MKSVVQRSSRLASALAAILVTLCLALTTPCTPHAQAATYPDVPTGAWYTEYVSYVSDRGLMGAYTDGTGRFAPEDGVTRAMVATVLYRYATGDRGDGGQVSNFSDVPTGMWYTKAVEWCRANGIVTGYAGTNLFGPMDLVTREQLATMIYRFANLYGKASAAPSPSFPDAGRISDFALQGVAWCNKAGIMTGDATTGLCNPQDTATRAQLAKMLTVLVRDIFGGSTPVITQDLSTATVSLSQSSFTYTGSAAKPSVTVKLGSTTLKQGTDYTVAYSNNVNAGTATVTVAGKGNFTGTASATFKISAASVSSATVTLLPSSFVYDGSAKKPSTTVKVGGKTLTFGVDYTLAYANNTAVGTATVTVTGKGNYTGSVKKTFTISYPSISSATVTLGTSTYTYDGSAKTPTVSVSLDGTALVKGTDYTVSYENNVNAGTATVTVTGTGHYSGTAAATFTIEPASITRATASVGTNKFSYTGSAIEPTVTAISVYSGTTRLVRTRDYTVSYENNLLANTDAHVVVQGTGNYTGKAVAAKFTIYPLSLASATVTLDQDVFEYDGEAKTPGVTVALNGRVLNRDEYTVTYQNNVEAGTATVTVRGTTTLSISTTSDKKPTITGVGGYTDSAEATFLIEGPQMAYALLYEDGSLVFQRGDSPDAAHGELVATFKGFEDAEVGIQDIPWADYRSDITSVSFAGGVKPVSMSYWFAGCESLASVDLSGLDGSRLTSLCGTFAGCTSLQSIDFRGLETKNVDSWAFLFGDYLYGSCTSLASVDLTGCSTRSTSSLSGMFLGCESLVDVKLFGLHSSVTHALDASDVFRGCSSLASLDLSGWDMSSVYILDGMFVGCAGLTNLDVSSWDTGSAISFVETFAGCESLASLDLSGWSTGAETSRAYYQTHTGPVSNWEDYLVIDMDGMFEGCEALDVVSLGGLFVWDDECPLPDHGGQGWWVGMDGTLYSLDTIPSGVAGTYTWISTAESVFASNETELLLALPAA